MTGVYILGTFLVALIVLDVLALRFGTDSRRKDGQANW
jgi:hypothetical protein